MPQDTACAGIQLQHRKVRTPMAAKNKSGNKYRNNAFQTVSQKCQGSCLFPQGTQGIGGPCVSASMLSNINPVHPAINIRCVKQPQYIAHSQTDNTLYHTSYSPSFLSRIINFSEVPLNPKASRILFSRYLV